VWLETALVQLKAVAVALTVAMAALLLLGSKRLLKLAIVAWGWQILLPGCFQIFFRCSACLVCYVDFFLMQVKQFSTAPSGNRGSMFWTEGSTVDMDGVFGLVVLFQSRGSVACITMFCFLQ
jgi:hypothetical protein